MTDWAIHVAVNTAFWAGWTVMVSGAIALTALIAWLASEAVWKAWKSWRGLSNIWQAFEALREKQAANGVQEVDRG